VGLLILALSFIAVVSLYLDRPVKTVVECDSYSVEMCPQKCVVCPPCEACSSISCQSEDFCNKIGFNRTWYDDIKKRITNFHECQEAGYPTSGSYPGVCVANGVEYPEDIEFEEFYENKIVYTTGTDQNNYLYKKDCEKRGGTFNECGSVCSPKAEVYVEVCAYTCEFEDGEKINSDISYNSFTERIQKIAVKRVGQPIEGFDAYILMQGLPGLLERDFYKVKTLEGEYIIEDEKLVFVRTHNQPVSSADQMITDNGYEALLQHLKGRFMTEDEDLIIDRISTAPDNPFCYDKNVLAVSECDGFSRVVYNNTDIMEINFRDDGTEISCSAEREDPECKQIMEIMISSMTLCIQVC
jgi:hypothetical protein